MLQLRVTALAKVAAGVICGLAFANLTHVTTSVPFARLSTIALLACIICYRPRFGRTSRRFWAELLSQVAAIVTPLIRYSLARPRNPQLATRLSQKSIVPRLDPAPLDARSAPN